MMLLVYNLDLRERTVRGLLCYTFLLIHVFYLMRLYALSMSMMVLYTDRTSISYSDCWMINVEEQPLVLDADMSMDVDDGKPRSFATAADSDACNLRMARRSSLRCFFAAAAFCLSFMVRRLPTGYTQLDG